MLGSGYRTRRTLVVWLVVIGAHGLVFILLDRISVVAVNDEDAGLVSIDLSISPQPREQPAASAPSTAARKTREGITRQGPPAARSGSAAVEDMQADDTALAVTPAPDWNAAAERAAKNVLGEESAATREFGTAPQSPYRGCTPRKSSLEWKPEAKRTGFSGGLPYVRVGKRCVIGLGFFACVVDELPPPDGSLLDDLNSPDAPQGSVPRPEDCVPTSPN